MSVYKYINNVSWISHVHLRLPCSSQLIFLCRFPEKRTKHRCGVTNSGRFTKSLRLKLSKLVYTIKITYVHSLTLNGFVTNWSTTHHKIKKIKIKTNTKTQTITPHPPPPKKKKRKEKDNTILWACLLIHREYTLHFLSRFNI